MPAKHLCLELEVEGLKSRPATLRNPRDHISMACPRQPASFRAVIEGSNLVAEGKILGTLLRSCVPLATAEHNLNP